MATVKTFLDKLTGQPEQARAAEQEVALLVKMAQFKLDTLENNIRNKFLNHQLESQIEIVGNKLSTFKKGYRVNFETGTLGDAVKGLVGGIMMIGKDDVRTMDIIGGAITNALEAMFSSVGISDQEEQFFTVVFSGMALVRYDFFVWKYDSTSNGLFKNTKSIVAYTYTSAVVDHKKVSTDELAQVFYNFLGANASVETTTEYLKKMKEAYAVLNEITAKDSLDHAQALTSFKKGMALEKLEELPNALSSLA